MSRSPPHPSQFVDVIISTALRRGSPDLANQVNVAAACAIDTRKRPFHTAPKSPVCWVAASTSERVLFVSHFHGISGL